MMEEPTEGSVSEGDQMDTDTIAAQQEQVQEAETEPVDTNTSSIDTRSQQLDTDGSDIYVDPAVVQKLTSGVIGLFLPNLQKAKGSLNEALHNQEVLIETVQQENAKFTDSAAIKQLTETMHEARIYHNKLITLKKEMTALIDRSTRTKRRAVKLQQQKQKEELNRAAQHERELEKERMLTAKVAKPEPPESAT